jgi:hypothetical protein
MDEGRRRTMRRFVMYNNSILLKNIDERIKLLRCVARTVGSPKEVNCLEDVIMGE